MSSSSHRLREAAVTFVFLALVGVMPALSFGRSLEECAAWFETCGVDLAQGARRHMTNGTNIAVYQPQKGAWYDATWLRDYVMMLEGRLIPKADMNPIAELFLSKVAPNGDSFDCIRYSGEVMWKPGYNECGENPVLDGYPYMTSLIYETWRQTGDSRWLGRRVLDTLAKCLAAMPRDRHYRLPWIDPEKEYDRCPWGFTDSVKKTGCVLFCSLLDVRAHRELAEMLEAADRKAEAKEARFEAQRIADAVNHVFWDDAHGLYRASTRKCRQLDIWGSAYAVWLGVADDARADRIACYFKAAYGGLVQNGQVRHLRPGEYWEDYNQYGLPGTYQNGFYWGTPTGWFCWTLERIDPKLVDKTYNDIVADYQKRGPYERTFGKMVACADYLASAALPLQGLRRLIAHRKGQPNDYRGEKPAK